MREVSEIVAMQESAIQAHPRKLVAVYENVRDVIKIGQHASWNTENGETLPLNEDEISLVQSYITCSSFTSAWYHLAGETSKRDQAAHSCANLISSLGADSEEVMRKYIESEQLWRNVIKREGVSPKRVGILAIILITTIVGAILVAIL